MIWDWDLWPWRIVIAFDSEYLLLEYRMQRNMDRAQQVLADALYPSLRPVAHALHEFMKHADT